MTKITIAQQDTALVAEIARLTEQNNNFWKANLRLIQERDEAKAKIQAAVVRALESAATACRMVRDHPETTLDESNGAVVCEQDIRAIAANLDQVVCKAMGVTE